MNQEQKKKEVYNEFVRKEDKRVFLQLRELGVTLKVMNHDTGEWMNSNMIPPFGYYDGRVKMYTGDKFTSIGIYKTQ